MYTNSLGYEEALSNSIITLIGSLPCKLLPALREHVH
jgi:hypothetical protein